MGQLADAIRHCLRKKQPVVSVIRTLIADDENAWEMVSDVLSGTSPWLQKHTVAALIRCGHSKKLADLILGDWPPSPAAWNAMMLIPDDALSNEQIRRRNDWAERLCEAPPDVLTQINAQLICRRLPNLTPKLIDCLSPLTLRAVCLFVTDETFPLLVRHLMRNDEPLPTVFGLALTPQRLLELSQEWPHVADRLGARHGYTDEVLIQAAVTLLSQGVAHVNQAMLERSPDDVLSDVDHVKRLLLRSRGELDAVAERGVEAHDRDHLSMDSDYEIGVLFAAARDLESTHLIHRRQANPFDFTSLRDLATDVVRLWHVPKSLLQRILITDARLMADQCQVPPETTSAFVVEHAAMHLQSDDDLRTEEELFLRARWGAMAATGDWNIELRKAELFETTRRLPAALSLVVPSRQLNDQSGRGRPRLISSPLPHFISPCAQAVCRLAQLYLTAPEFDSFCEQITQAESQAVGILRPVGVEVQIPVVDGNLYVAWKELFRSVGIASRRRPECGRMLEASLPPAASTEAVTKFLQLLLRLKIVAQQQDLGIHVSIQGRLGTPANYLAFPQLFLNHTVSSSAKPRDAMRLVMSKGLIHIDSEVQSCAWEGPATERTELRVFTAAISGVQHLTMDLDLVAAIEQTHLLASAMLSQDAKLQHIAERYIHQIDSCVGELPSEFSELLAADFFESTGEYTDPSLLEHLEILRRRDAVRKAAQCLDMQQIRSDLSELRRTHAESVKRLLPRHSKPATER